MIRRRQLLAAGAVTPIALQGASARAQAAEWRPDRPLQMIVGYSAGGGTDITARIIARFMEKDLGQPVVVINRPGAGGEIGFTEIARSRPDGYTIGFVNTPTIVSVPIERRAGFQLSSFSLLGNLIDDPDGLWVRPDSPYRTFADLLEDARRRPETIAYGTTGVGSDDHLAMLALERAAGVKFVHVPYAGSAGMKTDMASGTLPLACTNLGDCINDYRQGTLRPLAQMGATRWERLPDTPTLKELGYDVVEGSMRGVAAPAGVPAPIVARLALSIQRTVENPDFREQADQQNLPLRYLAPAAFLEELKTLDARCRELWARHPWVD